MAGSKTGSTSARDQGAATMAQQAQATMQKIQHEVGETVEWTTRPDGSSTNR